MGAVASVAGDLLPVQWGWAMSSGPLLLCRDTLAKVTDERDALITVLCSIINGTIRISDKANDMISEHDPKVIQARALVGAIRIRQRIEGGAL